MPLVGGFCCLSPPHQFDHGAHPLQGGEVAAQTIAKLAHDKGEVAVDNVNPGVSTTDARQAGFLS